MVEAPIIQETKKSLLYNPLDFDSEKAIQQLNTICTIKRDHRSILDSIDLSIFQQYLNQPYDQLKTQLLNTVSQCLLYRPLTLQIIQWFRPIAIDLIARLTTPSFTDFIKKDSLPSSNLNITVYKLEMVAKTFALTLPIVPQVKSLAVSYFMHSPSLFERLLQSSKDNITHTSNKLEIQDLLFTAYQLLHFSTNTFAPIWNWGILVQLLNHPYDPIRFLTALCLSKVYGLSDLQSKNLLNSVMGYSIDKTEDPIMATLDDTSIDLRMLSLWEQYNIANAQISLTHNPSYNIPNDSNHSLTSNDLCSSVTNICGILMAKPINDIHHVQPTQIDPQLILTETTSRNLHAIALALSIGAPTLLEGVTGAGKTSLVEDLAIRTGRGDQLVKIHLGDQTDPKVLLGTYVSTSTPGSFRWQSGVLTTAVQEGRWVLIEDIDLAPAEVLSVLLPLLETKKLFIPSRGEEIKAKEGFQLFGTRSLIPSKSGKGFHSRGGEMVTGANLWTRVHVDTLSITELEKVVRDKFKYIGDFTRHVMELFETIMNIYQDPNFTALSSSTFGRFISTRDLMKYCYRIDTLIGSKLGTSSAGMDQELGMDESIRLDLFSEAVDCFCGMISDYATWVVVLEKIGEPLQLSPAMVRHYIDQYKPSLDVADNHVRIGRVNLSSIITQAKQRQSLMKREKKRPFATTSHALRLMERIGVSIHLNEPVLLVGETGTGKTTVVQHLADMMHQNLVVVNMSQQSDSSDLLGGFKPVDGKVLAIPVHEEFEKLFEKTFSIKKNGKFLEAVRKSFIHKKWKSFIGLLEQSIKMSQQKFSLEDDQSNKNNDMENNDDEKNKSRRTTSPQLRKAWKIFDRHVEEFKLQQTQAQNKFVFSFMEGSLVKAVRNGDWILMDEINLATTETLECLSGLLENAESSLLLTEKGDLEPIKRHPNFRLFACMNPATDVGKRDLPPGLRNRFTEFYVHSPDSRYEDLLQIVRQYILPIATGDERACEDVAQFYMEAKKLSQQHKLVDGANQRPHFSIRTLSRALTYVCQIYPTYGLRRSLYEGFCMTFLTQLNKESETLMHQHIYKTILNNINNPKHLITQIPRQPQDNYIQFGYFWLEQGQFDPIEDTGYIMTPSVETKLYNLARVIMSRKFPVLIQGPTSAGKTSMIEYLAKKTGHRFVRINNHEHTDLQEYLGTYVSNNEGKLVFQEGVLVEALRNGYWIVLDELNLAPSDVLEALNRLLDDNRELLIPETQEIVKPHPHFMLFATQNPAGLYGGRKALSRAFRNRFLELHFDDIPEDELETILSKRCRIAPSYCKKLVQVYKSLMERRQSTRIFEQRHGFITLRDLFRWAGRDPNGYQELAEHGYMLLAERCRRDEEKVVVKQVLESVMKVKLNENDIYDTSRLEEFSIYDQMLKNNAAQTGQDTALVWTKAMKRLFTLVARCLKYNEPVLLVGDTGCGKTTVCQMLAETYGRELHIVNCHQNTETGDLLGGQRPVRHDNQPLENDDVDNNNKKEQEEKQKALFEWHDGPLVQSMRQGHLFLLDEISLADDSVLERLNSVLEPSRLLVLAEKGGKHVEELYGASGFQFLATMNPGGDYGKKELSPALRNRFTEIWVPSVTDRDDLTSIINEQFSHPDLQIYTEKILNFIEWYMKALGQSRTVISLRDILSWVKFINTGVSNGLDGQLCFVHGCCIVLLDGLGSHGSSGSFLAGDALKEFRLKCLRELVNNHEASENEILCHTVDHSAVSITDNQFAIGPFHISRGKLDKTDIKFTLLAPTTSDNAMRVIRSMQLKKPILLEGSPGVGKTSLISALAAASGHNLVRINLSEQTDLMDLFGSDLPVEGGNSGEFAWRDAPFLQAMKAGDWVLLDELNLASQSVLEGLNSCLDHRGAVYIPELDREFFCAPGFRVFGAQNPLQQGGGRKGLPKSFVNRFTQVYVEHLTADDLLFICTHLFSEFEPNVLQKMIDFNTAMYTETMIKCSFGRKGSPWEFNLRDVFRWLELLQNNNTFDPMEYLDTIYIQRMRTHEDRLKVIELYENIFNVKYNKPLHPQWQITPNTFNIGNSSLPRLQSIHNGNSNNSASSSDNQYHILQSFLSPLQSLMKCVESGWMAILTGPSASGKTSLVRLLSKITGNRLEEFAMNNSVDTMELLGGFEQVDLNRHRQVIIDQLRQMTNRGTQVLLDYLSTIESTLIEERQKIIQQIRQLNDAWFSLERHQQLQRESEHHTNESLDYSLVSALLNYLNSTCHIDNEASILISQIVESIKHLQQLEKDSVAGKFEWIDGLLINALENGHWLLIDNANLCNPSVLDRLNPLFENNGVLMVNERGLVDGTVKVIKPHPNFRMFMTVDPQNGELSRAMRNRGIEITLVDSQWNNNNTQDVTKIANGLSLRGPQLPLLLNDLQEDAALQRKHLRSNKNVRDYLLLARYIVERLQRGQTLKSAIQESFYQVFVDIKEVPAALLKLLEMNHEEENDLLLQNIFSPTNCPLFIGGNQYQQDSRLATVALQGAYFLYLVQQLDNNNHGDDDINMKKNDDYDAEAVEMKKKQHLRKIEIAGDYFLETMTMDDYGIRLRWLGFVSQHCSIKHHQQIERLGYLVKLIKAHPIFTEWSSDNNNSSVKNAYKLFIRLCKQEYAMATIRNASQRLKVNNLTVIQQSYCLQEGRISESQLLHPIVAKLYPYFSLVYGNLLQWVSERGCINSSLEEFDWINEILDLSDFAWDSTQSTTLPIDNLLIILRFMKELMLNESFNTTLFTSCRNSIDEIMSSFDFEVSKSMKELWKYFGPATLSTKTLYDLEKEIIKISESLNSYNSHNDDHLKPTDTILYVNQDIKETIIEGIATLYAVDEKKERNAQKLAKSLQQLPEYLRTQLATIKIPTADSTSCWNTALIPLYDYTSLVKEMEILSQLYILSCDKDKSVIPTQLLNNLKEFRSFVLNKTSRPPLDLVPYQRLLWTLDSNDAQKLSVILPGLIQDAIHNWQQRLWKSSVVQSQLHELVKTKNEKDLIISEGSLNLYEGVESLICLNIICSVDRINTEMMETALKQLKGLKEHLATKVDVANRNAFELVTLLSMAAQLFTASSATISKDIYNEISSQLIMALLSITKLSDGNVWISSKNATEYNNLINYLEKITTLLKDYKFNDQFVLAITSLSEAIQLYQNENGSSFYLAAGKTRTLLGLSFVECYIPDYPVDPTSEPRLQVDLLTRKQQHHINEIEVRENIEDILTGNKTNTNVEDEKSRLENIDTQLSTTATTFSLRPTKSQLDDIFVDLRYLQQNMLEKNAKNLLHDLEKGDLSNTTILQREKLLQSNAHQFIDRVQAKFAMYRDILQPLLVAVDNIKYGLRLMTSAYKKDETDTFLTKVIQLLLCNPDISKYDEQLLDWHTLATFDQLAVIKNVIFERAPMSRKWAFYLRLLIVVLQHLVIHIYNTGYIQSNDIISLNTVFSEIVYIWKSAQDYKRQKEAEKEQLYKTRAKRYEPATDEELDEMDRKKIFADFNDEFADLAIDEDAEKENNSKSNFIPDQVEEESVLDPADIQKICLIHQSLYNDFNVNLVSRHGTKNWDREQLQSYALAGQLTNLSTSTFGTNMDLISQAAHLHVTDLTIRRLESNDSFSMISDDIYDFYTCENVNEAKLTEPVIRRMKNRLLTILEEWPEHAILEQLITICDRILSFSITSPVSKFLTGIELLLQKSEDWEAYAAKHVSLSAERDELIKMIIRWRQLELNCWPKLLAAQEQYNKTPVYELWFQLYDAINVPIFAGDDDKELTKKNTEELLAALDQFMQTSSLNQFNSRLDMIDSFYRQTLLQAQLYDDKKEKNNFIRVSSLLANSFTYYSQFKDHAKLMFNQLRKPIEKDIKDFVKIATWKDVNIYALRQSAYKTHRQLHKCIRKYRDVLNTSMLTVIANYNEERAMFQYGDDKKYNDINKGFIDQLSQPKFWLVSTKLLLSEPNEGSSYDWSYAPEVKRHLVNLNTTLSRLQTICQTSIFQLTKSLSTTLLEEFMNDIIHQIKHFQKETPSELTEENKSMVKNQKLLKKKTLVDFLKELKRLGLKWRTTDSLVERNSKTSILFKQRIASLETILVQGSHLFDHKQKQLTSFCGLSQDMIGFWSRSNDYYFRSVARLTHLRSVSKLSVSKDLSPLEVERSMAATEHMLSMVIKERSILSRFEDKLQVLQGASIQLSALFSLHSSSSSITQQEFNPSLMNIDSQLGYCLILQKNITDQISFLLQQALSVMKIQYSNNNSVLGQVHMVWNKFILMQKEIDHIFGQRYLYPQSTTGIILLSNDIQPILQQNINTLMEMKSSLLEILEDKQELYYLLYPITQQLDHYLKNAQKEYTPSSSMLLTDNDNDDITMLTFRDKVFAFIDAILVAVQDLKKIKSTSSEINNDNKNKNEEDDDEQEENDMIDNYIQDQHNKQFELTNALHLETLVNRCMNLLTLSLQLSQKHTNKEDDIDVSQREILNLLQQVYPFLQQYMWLAQHTLGEILVHHKSMAKMTYCLINSFTLIITKGFCMPEGMTDEEEGDANGMSAGTGIGEGEGDKDVSNEIEDEEQVLGTQNEEPSKDENKNKPETKEEKEGLDMENDFDGQLEDIEQDEDQDQDSDDSDSDEEDPDEQIGDVDDMDPDAVDDKMWGDEAEENLKESDKTVDQGQNQDEQQKDTDIVAQEEDQDQDSIKPDNKKKNEQQQKDNKEDESQQPDNEEQEEGGDQDEGEGGDDQENESGAEDEEGIENQPGEKMNADIPEAETLELPDDLNMDGDEEDGNDEGPQQNEEDPMDIDDHLESENDEAFHDPLDDDEQNAVEHDQGTENDLGEDDQEMEDSNAHVNKDKEGDEEEEGEGDEGEENQPEEENAVGDLDNQDQQQQGATIDENEEEDQKDTKGQNREQPNSKAIADNQFGVQGEAGKTSSSSHGQKEGEEDDGGENDDDDKKDEDKKNQENSGVADQGSNEHKSEEDKVDFDKNNKENMKSNPQRSLGDALENWRRRLGDVADAEEDEEENEQSADNKKDEDDQQPKDTTINENNPFEYVKNDEDAHDMQTMGNAAADQIQDLKLGAMDEEMNDAENMNAGEEELDDDVDMENADTTSNIDTMPLPKDNLDSHHDENDQRGGAILSKQLPQSANGTINPDEEELHGLTVDESILSREPLEQEDIERMRNELECKVSEWREEGRDLQQARDLWQGYENLTHDLAMGLCEQLRLILEPTLATKLKGDYRTGKRLNMKKIIPYIASQFKKDKIWLRRTKPSKRQYQIMISVDDSKSMSESHSVQLAYETLSLISKALSQLEVGDISITSFGERIRLLHPFDQPFTAESGATVLQQFTFAQEKTYVKNLVESSLSLFENAKHGASHNSELWQLQLIISDGICEDHETLRSLVRRAMDEHVMIIFIVVDNKPEKDSILNMTNVKYVTTNGKLSLQMAPYLETFPFQYFMILRDINSLPEALSDALRQYFSFVAA
ncbi:unnamed protein product [Cunninghamella blakesleeana]